MTSRWCHALAVLLVAAGCAGSSARDDDVTVAPTSTEQADGTLTATTVDAEPTNTGQSTQPAPLRTPSASEPLRVTIIGDSVMFDAALGIQHSLESTGVVVTQSRAIGAVGLSVEAWPQFIDEVLADTEPELIVLMVGGWDLGVVEFEGPDVYRPLVSSAIDTMTAGDTRIVWLAMPPTPPAEGLEPHRMVLNSIYAEAAAQHPLVTFVDTNAALGDPDGMFARYLPGPDGSEVQARKVRDGRDDGHLCPGGAAILGELVFDSLGMLTALAPRGDWLEGEWTNDQRYDDPPGGCAG